MNDPIMDKPKNQKHPIFIPDEPDLLTLHEEHCKQQNREFIFALVFVLIAVGLLAWLLFGDKL